MRSLTKRLSPLTLSAGGETPHEKPISHRDRKSLFFLPAATVGQNSLGQTHVAAEYALYSTGCQASGANKGPLPLPLGVDLKVNAGEAKDSTLPAWAIVRFGGHLVSAGLIFGHGLLEVAAPSGDF